MAITPLFWRIRDKTKTITHLAPLFYHSVKPEKTRFSLLYFLLRHYKTDDITKFGLLSPIVSYEKTNSGKRFRIAPIIWYGKTDTYKYFSIQPFYYQSIDSVSKNHYILWQLFTRKNYYGKKVSNNFLWKVLSLDKYANGDYEFRLLHLFATNIKKDDSVQRSFFPFFSYEREKNGNRSFSMLFWFYSRFSKRLPDSNEFYHEEKIFWFIRLRSNFRQLKSEGKL